MSVTSPAGFRAAGVVAGLKSSGAKDVALVVNDGPLHVAAAVFTTNRVVGWPVLWSRQVVGDGVAHAVALNSGGANACTEKEGFGDVHRTAEQVAAVTGVSAGDVVVCSTGLIGERLPAEKLLAGVAACAAALGPEGGPDAAEAIMTTDSVPKTVTVAGQGFTIGGMAKGAGMLAPGLATMLCVLTTDAVLTPALADAALRSATRTTFERIDSDGCMSTSDTVTLLASGASGHEPDEADFTAALTQACSQLARALIADAEGATKEIAVRVTSAHSEDAAVAVARAVTRSNLFKAAMFGEDPNWGRILSQVGTVPEEVAAFDAHALDVAVNDVWICRNGTAAADRSLVDLSGRVVNVQIDLDAGNCEATVWTNDLTHAYVHENSAYST